ncbi:MobF family relaxase [Geovibrio sp. ADMFC3]
MSLARGVSASQASDYYYEKDPILAPEGKAESSFWYGELSSKFNLEHQPIKAAQFSALLFGMDPLTAETLIDKGVNGERRAGVDLAFSAPKSLSVMALHVGDEKLIEAHTEAVKSALDYYEKNYAYARKTIDNKTTPDFTGNIIAACFTHSTSRSIDPQLHTHAVVINMTETDRGFRAIDNYQLFNQQNLLLNVYQSELAFKVQELGYSIEVGRNGNWEIAGVDKDILEAFSKRSKEIEEEAKLLKAKHPEWSEAKIRDVATLKSRDSKDSKITEPELREEWDKTADKKQIKDSVDKASEVQLEKPSVQDAKTVLREAAKAIHENESTFRKEELLNTAMRLSRGQLLVNELEAEMKNMFSAKELQKVGDKTRSGYIHDLISTKEQIEMEKSVLNMAKEGKNAMVSIMLPDKISEKLKDSSLTAGQEAMVANMLSSADRFTIVQGDAGTGKTFAVNTFNKIVSSVNPDIRVHLMGFTGRASYELEQATGVKASTIDSFLLALQKESEESKPQRSVWIVDEASMVSSKHFHEIMTNAKKYNASVHFVGDGKQLQAVGAGRLFKDLQALNVVKTIEMGEVLRQRTGYMKHLVENIKNYQEGRSSDGIINAFEVMEDKKRLIEASGAGDRLNKAVELYLSHYREGNSVIMITPINKKRQELNNAIREKLKNSGEIKDGKTFATKQVVSLSGANRRIAGNYEEGMHIFLSSKFGGIKAGSEGVIKEIDKKSNTVRVTFGSRDLQINLGKHGEKISAFRVEEREFSEGDKIVFGKNDKMLNVQNGSVGIIEKIDGSNLTVKMEDGSQRKLDSEKSYSFIDYGYALTVHKSQGQTADISILYTDAGTRAKDDRRIKEEALAKQKKQIEKGEKPDSLQKIIRTMTKEKSRFLTAAIDDPESVSSINTSEVLYVSATRAKDDFYIITDSAEDLILQTSHEQFKTSTIDPLEIKREEIREQIKDSFKDLKFYKHGLEEVKEKDSGKQTIEQQVKHLKEQFNDNEKNKNSGSEKDKLDELERNIALKRNKEKSASEKVQNEDKDFEQFNKEISEKISSQKQLLQELFGGEQKEKNETAKDELFKYDEQEKNEELERI